MAKHHSPATSTRLVREIYAPRAPARSRENLADWTGRPGYLNIYEKIYETSTILGQIRGVRFPRDTKSLRINTLVGHRDIVPALEYTAGLLLVDADRLAAFEKVRNDSEISVEEGVTKIQGRFGISLWLCDVQLAGCNYDKVAVNEIYSKTNPEKTNNAFARGLYALYLRSFDPCTLKQLHYQLSALGMNDKEVAFCRVLTSSTPNLTPEDATSALSFAAQCASIDQWTILCRCCQSLVVNGYEDVFEYTPLLWALFKLVPCVESTRLLNRFHDEISASPPLPPPNPFELSLAGQPTDDEDTLLAPLINSAAGHSLDDALLALTSLRQIHLTWNRYGALISASRIALTSLSAFRHGVALQWCELLGHPDVPKSPLELTTNALYAGSFAPADRTHVDECINHMYTSAWDAALESISKLPDSRETAALRLDALIHAGRPYEALEVAALATVNYATLVPRLPLRELAEIAKKLPRRNFTDCLVVSVIFQSSVRQSSPKFSRYRNECFEDALELSATEKPSEWISLIGDTASPVVRQLLPYVLQTVCVPSVMDTVPVCGSSRELLEERMQILQGLLESGCKDDYRIREEIVSLSSGLAVTDELQFLDQHRIYVDVEGLANQLAESLRPDFEMYKRMIMVSSQIDTQRKISLIIGQPLGALRAQALANAGLALKAMYEQVRTEFLLSRDYGLDGYLSGSIRHGSLESLLREPLSTPELLGVFRGDIFHPPSFYRTCILTADEYVQHEVFDALKRLAETLQMYIDELNRDWVRVDIQGANPVAMFRFDDADLNLSNLEKVATVEDFVARCLDAWWERVRQSLTEARSFVRNEISFKLHEIVKDFQDHLTRLNNDFVRALAHNVPGNVRTNIDAALEKLCEWLRLSELQEGVGPFEPEFAVQVAKSAIERLHRSIKFNWAEEIYAPKLRLTRRSLKPLVDIWLLLFSNVVKHSTQTGSCTIKIDVAYTEGLGLLLSVTNPIGDGSIDTHVSRAKALIEAGNYGDAVTKEGQAGLMKVLKTARVDLRAHESCLTVSKEPSSTFRVAVTINPIELHCEREENE